MIGDGYGRLIGDGYGRLIGDGYGRLIGDGYGRLIGDGYGRLIGDGYGRLIGDGYGRLIGDSYGRLIGDDRLIWKFFYIVLALKREAENSVASENLQIFITTLKTIADSAQKMMCSTKWRCTPYGNDFKSKPAVKVVSRESTKPIEDYGRDCSQSR